MIGIKVPGQFVPGTVDGFVTEARWVKGTYIVVKTVEEANLVPMSVRVDGTAVPVYGLGNAAYANTDAFDAAGWISWTKAQGSGGAAPAAVNIRGPQGPQGPTGSVASVNQTGSGFVSSVSLDDTTKVLNVTRSAVKIDDGEL